MLNNVTTACQEKRKVLEEQHQLIEAEKNKVTTSLLTFGTFNIKNLLQVQQECEGLQYQVEVRNITQRIGSLSEKLDSASMLGEPRENAFLTCDFEHNNSAKLIEDSLQQLGKVRTSTTFPSLCTASIEDTPAVSFSLIFCCRLYICVFQICGLETTVVLRTVDYHGDLRSSGGDPITAEVYSENASSNTLLPTKICDNDDGTYNIYFR